MYLFDKIVFCGLKQINFKYFKIILFFIIYKKTRKF